MLKILNIKKPMSMVKKADQKLVSVIRIFLTCILNRFSLLVFIGFIIANTGYGQKERSTYAGLQLLGPSIVTFQYERELIEVKKFQLLGDLGFGIAQFPKGTEPNQVPISLVIHTGIPIQYRIGHFGFIGGVNPSVYFRGSLSFIDLSGFFGLRLDLAKPSGGGGPYFTFAYTPKIYNSLQSGGSIYPHKNFAFRFGASF